MPEKHTPGPWRLHRPGGNGRLTVIGPDTYAIALIYHQGEVYADLIAAAPELLEALLELTAQYADVSRNDLDSSPCFCGEVIGTCAHCRAVAAIAKAEGRNA